MRPILAAALLWTVVTAAAPVSRADTGAGRFFIGGSVGAGWAEVMSVGAPVSNMFSLDLDLEPGFIGGLRVGRQLYAGLSVGLDQRFIAWNVDHRRRGIQAVHAATVTFYPLAWDETNDMRGFYLRAGAGVGWGHARADDFNRTTAGFGYTYSFGYEWMFGRAWTFSLDLGGGGMTASYGEDASSPTGFGGAQLLVTRYIKR